MIYADRLPARIFAALGERREFSLGDVVEAMEAKTYKERNDLFRCLKVMARRGLVSRNGDHGFVRNDDTRSRPLWRFLRAAKSATLDDLIEIGGGLDSIYIRRWLTAMIRSNHIRKEGRVYRLLTDSREEPPVLFIKCDEKMPETKQYNKHASRKSALSKGRNVKKGR